MSTLRDSKGRFVKVSVDDRKMKALVKKLGVLASKKVRVGVLGSKGGNEDRDGITMVELMAIHEFGSPAANIPKRAPIKGTFDKLEVQREQAKLSAKLMDRILDDKITIDQALELLGTWGAAQVKNRITNEDIPPPLKPATIAKKGSTKPLVDTGRLLGSITHEVE